MNELRSFTFGKGRHKSREDGLCVMEAVAMLAGEKHSDSPECACPVITELSIWLNDSCSDALRQELLDSLPYRIVGTRSPGAVEQKRAFMAADWAVSVVAPRMLRQAGLYKEAAALESLPPITDAYAASAAVASAAVASAAAARAAEARAYAAMVAVASAAVASAAVASAAVASAYAARAAVARAYAAMAAAARAAEARAYAARAAVARAAAASAAAASAAAASASADLEFIQRSCADLLDRMIRLTEPQEVIHASRPAAEVPV